MLQANNHLNFASLRPKAPSNEFMSIKSTKNTGISRTVKFGEFSRPTSLRDGSTVEDKLKVVKLIGNQNQNVEEILSGLSCHCGCRPQMKKILTLLMGKIYRLREERNQLRHQLQEASEERKKEGGVGVGVGINTEQDMMQEHMRDQLLKLIEDSKLKSRPSEAGEDVAVEVGALGTEEVQDLMGINRYTSITFEHEANQTNLLDSPMRIKEEGLKMSKMSFEHSQSFEERALKQCGNTQNRLGNLKSYCNQRSLNLDTIEDYIEKLNCAKQLNKYQTQKRRNAIF